MLGKSLCVQFLWLWKGYSVFPMMPPAKPRRGNETLVQLLMPTTMTCRPTAQTVSGQRKGRKKKKKPRKGKLSLTCRPLFLAFRHSLDTKQCRFLAQHCVFMWSFVIKHGVRWRKGKLNPRFDHLLLSLQ